MKRLSVLLFLIVSLSVCFHAEPVRKVLVTLNTNEKIYLGEYLSNYHSSSYGFICVLINTSTEKMTLVWNGERKLTADNLELCHIDLGDFNKCCYIYNIGNDCFLKLENTKYGPYKNIRYNDWYPMMEEGYAGSKTRYINKYHFWFYQMGAWYVHDHDGTIYKEEEGKFDFYSPNKQHHAIIAKNKRMITIDNTNYVIPIPVDFKIDDQPDLCLFDDGSCYYTQWGQNGGWKRFMYYITPTEVRPIDEKTEYFDLDAHIIKLRSSIPKNNAYPNFWGLPWKYNREKESNYLAYEFSLQDKSKNHLFIAKWDYDYVLIDGKRYGKQCPIDAFYNSVKNAFCWVVVDNNQIVLYTYPLSK